MQVQKFKRAELSLFDDFAREIGVDQSRFIPLLDLPFSLENFEQQIKNKTAFPQSRRKTLRKAFVEQYQKAGLAIPEHLDLILDERCFTVCTGHQLNLFTGPLYSIFKIVHVISLSQTLAKKYPDFHFLPVFWMASEDHDLDEIDHFFVGDNRISWEAKQSGPVGRMQINKWSDWQQELKSLFPGHDNLLDELFSKYQGNDLATAARKLVHHLFSALGLLILDGDDPNLKKQFVPVFERELNSSFSKAQVLKSEAVLAEKGLKVQAHSRDINLFLLGPNARERIERSEDGFKVAERFYSHEEMFQLLSETPENFSPNVILRPLYQEFCLPNLCYVGGSAELAYWLQLKPVFDEFQEPFPLLKLRFSAQIASQKLLSKLEKFQYSFPEFSQDIHALIRDFVARKSERESIPSALKVALSQIEQTFAAQAKALDQTLLASSQAHLMKIEKAIHAFENRVSRAEKRKHRESIDQIADLHQSLFPNGKLQERKENFIGAYLNSKGALIPFLLENIDAIEDEFLLLATGY